MKYIFEEVHIRAKLLTKELDIDLKITLFLSLWNQLLTQKLGKFMLLCIIVESIFSTLTEAIFT